MKRRKAEAAFLTITGAIAALLFPGDLRAEDQPKSSSAGTPLARKFEPALLKIGTQYSLERHDYGDFLRASRWGFIDPNGKVVVEPQYANVGTPSESVTPVLKNGWGFLDKAGAYIDAQLSNQVAFHEGLAAFHRGEKWGFMDVTGKVVIEPQWEDAGYFSEELASVSRNGKWGFIDKTGKVVTELRWTLRTELSEGLAAVRAEGKDGKDGKVGFIDKTGRVVIEPRWDGSLGFEEGMALVEMNRKVGFIDKTGKIVVQPEWEDCSGDYSEGLVPVAKDKKWGFIDKTGKLVIPLEWDMALPFSGGLAAVTRDGKWGFVDKNGKVVIEPQFENVNERGFVQRVAPVKQSGKWGLIDAGKRFIIDPQWGGIDAHQQAQGAPVYWMVWKEIAGSAAREPHILVKWFDSTGKEIWSSEPKKPAG